MVRAHTEVTNSKEENEQSVHNLGKSLRSDRHADTDLTTAAAQL